MQKRELNTSALSLTYQYRTLQSANAVFPNANTDMIPPNTNNDFKHFLPIIIHTLAFFNLKTSYSEHGNNRSFNVPFIYHSINSAVHGILTLVRQNEDVATLDSDRKTDSFL